MTSMKVSADMTKKDRQFRPVAVPDVDLGGFWGWVEFDRFADGSITGDGEFAGCGHSVGGGGPGSAGAGHIRIDVTAAHIEAAGPDDPNTGGHVFYVDAPWALTSISQSQFWHARDFARDYGDGAVRESVSVDIGAFDTPGTACAKFMFGFMRVAGSRNQTRMTRAAPSAYVRSPL